jgi:hypothetical protein
MGEHRLVEELDGEEGRPRARVARGGTRGEEERARREQRQPSAPAPVMSPGARP